MSSKSEDSPQQLLHGAGAWVLKLLIVVFGVLSCCLAVYGLTLINKEVVDEGWAALEVGGVGCTWGVRCWLCVPVRACAPVLGAGA